MRTSVVAAWMLGLAVATDVALRVSGRGGFPWLLSVYLVMSLVTFAVFAWDKGRAVRGGRRVPEATLQFLAFAFGWPGALVAIAAVRHKTRKPSFLVVIGLAAAVHITLWCVRISWG